MKLWFILLLLAACDHDAPERPSSTKSAPAPSASARSLAGIEAELDGRPLALRSMVAYSRGGAALQLAFSTHTIGCEDIAGRGTQRIPGETTVDLTLAPSLSREGRIDWKVTRGRVGEMARQGELGSATVKAFDPEHKVDATFDVTLTFPTGAARGAGKLHIKGSIQSEGCGVVPYAVDARIRPQKDLKLELAGRAIVVRGASLTRTGDGGVSLLLTSEPHVCSSGTLGADVAVTLELTADGAPRRVRIDGYAFATTLDRELDGAGVAARIATTDAASTARVELAGGTEVAGFRLMLDGTADAEVCPARN